MGRSSEKCTVRWICHCVNIIEHTSTELYSITYHYAPRHYGRKCCIFGISPTKISLVGMWLYFQCSVKNKQTESLPKAKFSIIYCKRSFTRKMGQEMWIQISALPLAWVALARSHWCHTPQIHVPVQLWRMRATLDPWVTGTFPAFFALSCLNWWGRYRSVHRDIEEEHSEGAPEFLPATGYGLISCQSWAKTSPWGS